MKRLVAFVHIVDKMNMWIAKVLGFLVIPLAAVLLYGVIMRYIFVRPVHWVGDISWSLFVTFSVLAGAYVLRQDGHVRLDVMYGRLSPKRRAILDMVTFPFFLLLMVLFTWFTIKKAWWSVSIMEKNPMSYFHGPIYPARIVLAVGGVLLILQGVAEFIGHIARITGHDIEGRAN